MISLNYRTLLLLSVALYLTGCVHTEILSKDTFETVNPVFVGGKQTVTLPGNHRLNVKGAQVVSDSLVWRSFIEDTLLVTKIALTEVAYVDVINRGRGAFEGLALFGAGGFIAGALIGAGSYEECESIELLGCLFRSRSRIESATWGGLGGGLVGILIGPLFGAATGSKDRYIFSSNTSVKGSEALPSNVNDVFGNIAVGDSVLVMRFKSYWPRKYEGIVVKLTSGYLVLDIGKGPFRIRRNSIQSIQKKSADVES